MNKPIEPGCGVITTYQSCAGCSGRVKRLVRELEQIWPDRPWVAECDMWVVVFDTRQPIGSEAALEERYLRRIDDYDPAHDELTADADDVVEVYA